MKNSVMSVKGLAMALCLLAVPFGSSLAADATQTTQTATSATTNAPATTKSTKAVKATKSKVVNSKVVKDNGKVVTKTTTKKTTTKASASNKKASTGSVKKTVKSTSKTTTPVKTTAAANGNSAMGCCSNHQGVARCDVSSGFQMCKDGTKSPTCRCSQ